jgi:hypothetical protein
MTPDEHAALAEDMIQVADGWFHDHIDNVIRSEQDPTDHMFVQTLSGLAQVHAILSLRRPPPAQTSGPGGADLDEEAVFTPDPDRQAYPRRSGMSGDDDGPPNNN